MHFDREVETRAEDILAEKTKLVSLLDREGHVFDRQGIFLSDVDIALVGADGIRADGQAFKDRERVSLQDAPVHISPGVSLIGVDDHILGFILTLASKFPL